MIVHKFDPTVTHAGLSPFGGEYTVIRSDHHDLQSDALVDWAIKFAAFVDGAEELAWRVRPHLESGHGLHWVYSRLAVKK